MNGSHSAYELENWSWNGIKFGIKIKSINWKARQKQYWCHSMAIKVYCNDVYFDRVLLLVARTVGDCRSPIDITITGIVIRFWILATHSPQFCHNGVQSLFAHFWRRIGQRIAVHLQWLQQLQSEKCLRQTLDLIVGQIDARQRLAFSQTVRKFSELVVTNG